MAPSKVQDILLSLGFVDVKVEEKPQSREIIKTWMPGSGAEDYVVSANITARKPQASDGQDADLTSSTGGFVLVGDDGSAEACCAPKKGAAKRGGS